MTTKNQFLFACCTIFSFCELYSADNRIDMQCDEQLPDYENLTPHMAFLPAAVHELHMYGKNNTFGLYTNDQEHATLRQVVQYTSTPNGRKWNISGTGYTFTINKKINDNGFLLYDDFTKKLAVNCGCITSIGNIFAQHSFLQYLLTINLDHNNLKSFDHIQVAIFEKCHYLKKFSAKHNAFEGSLIAIHQTLDMLDLSYNGFTAIRYVSLPNATTIDLRNNKIKEIETIPRIGSVPGENIYLEGNPLSTQRV